MYLLTSIELTLNDNFLVSVSLKSVQWLKKYFAEKVKISKNPGF